MYRSLIRLEPQSGDIEMREFLQWNFNEFPGGVGHATVGVTVYNLNFPHLRTPSEISIWCTLTHTPDRTHAEHKSRKIQNHQFDWPVKMFDNPVWILASSVNVNTEQCLKFLSPWLHYVHSAAVDNSTTSNQYTTDLLTD